MKMRSLRPWTQKVTFYSRSKDRLWTKGRDLGQLAGFCKRAEMDCDADTILNLRCHMARHAIQEAKLVLMIMRPAQLRFLDQLSALIAARHRTMPNNSYTTSLFRDGAARIAQKVGEEGLSWPWRG